MQEKRHVVALDLQWSEKGQAELDVVVMFRRSEKERGAIKRQRRNKRKRKEREGKTKFIFRIFREERAYGVLSETFIFLLVGRTRAQQRVAFGRYW